MVGMSLFLVFYDSILYDLKPYEQGNWVVKGAGLIGLFFFVPAGLYALVAVFPKYLKRPVSFVLTSDGLERRTSQGSAFIPWQDVAEIGILTISGNDQLGLRLSSYDYYLNNMTPPVAQELKGPAAVGKMLHRVMRMGLAWDAGEARSLWSRLAGAGDPAAALKEMGDLGALAEMLLISRHSWGYDLLFASYDSDRPARELGELMEKYHQRRV
jgi:hypothetical protein